MDLTLCERDALEHRTSQLQPLQLAAGKVDRFGARILENRAAKKRIDGHSAKRLRFVRKIGQAPRGYDFTAFHGTESIAQIGTRRRRPGPESPEKSSNKTTAPESNGRLTNRLRAYTFAGAKPRNTKSWQQQETK